MTNLVRGLGAGALILALGATAGCSVLPKPYTGPVVAAVDSCSDLTASIYFDPGSAALTRDARALLRGAAAQAESCQFSTVHVVGLADPVGAPAANVALSKRRADAVSAELARLGFNQVTFNLVAAGDVGAVTTTGEIQPLRRRADVIFSRAR